MCASRVSPGSALSPDPRPILWSFRRCPYAMRARLAIAASGVPVEMRDILLRDKPAAFLAASPSATVPCLDLGSEGVIDESLDIMLWALRQSDPEQWLDMADEGHALIAACEEEFKPALDRYKYETRYPESDPTRARDTAARFVMSLEARLAGRGWLMGNAPRLADMAILPFIRQFAHVDQDWFAAQPWPGVTDWLSRFKASDRFSAIMERRPIWEG